uniref:Uncharacterized protein n=1 Tax=Physcomitrium patens TaxID=3218 RepID=A0A2K1L2E3_PHYPA|nr:uncharacterized protein LOC112295610 [Physcomitrium patens]PNR60190.1 hypothetical protein PHYPA_002983 [Physcomitrium patens]|eukprot:XP_024403190.1 uncharacterized protein LOC112295610 [Physcomitrella patens]
MITPVAPTLSAHFLSLLAGDRSNLSPLCSGQGRAAWNRFPMFLKSVCAECKASLSLSIAHAPSSILLLADTINCFKIVDAVASKARIRHQPCEARIRRWYQHSDSKRWCGCLKHFSGLQLLSN